MTTREFCHLPHYCEMCKTVHEFIYEHPRTGDDERINRIEQELQQLRDDLCGLADKND